MHVSVFFACSRQLRTKSFPGAQPREKKKQRGPKTDETDLTSPLFIIPFEKGCSVDERKCIVSLETRTSILYCTEVAQECVSQRIISMPARERRKEVSR